MKRFVFVVAALAFLAGPACAQNIEYELTVKNKDSTVLDATLPTTLGQPTPFAKMHDHTYQASVIAEDGRPPVIIPGTFKSGVIAVVTPLMIDPNSGLIETKVSFEGTEFGGFKKITVGKTTAEQPDSVQSTQFDITVHLARGGKPVTVFDGNDGIAVTIAAKP